jgi:hypothetical protein
MADVASDTATPAHHSPLELPKPVQDGRKKVLLILEEEVLDYKHNGAAAVEDAVSTLATYFGNVVQDPEDDKYRRVIVGRRIGGCTSRRSLEPPLAQPARPGRAECVLPWRPRAPQHRPPSAPQIRSTNKAFLAKVCRLHTRNGENPAERLMVAAGWRQSVRGGVHADRLACSAARCAHGRAPGAAEPRCAAPPAQVIDMQKFWVFDAPAGDTRFE